MRVFKIMAGVILILTGIFCFAVPGATFLSIAFVLGCAMLLSGMSGISAYIWIRKEREVSSHLLLVEGILSVILGILVLANQLVADAAIPVFFGMWVMFSGIVRVVDGYFYRESEGTIWRWLVSLGSLGILTGFYAFFNTVIFAFSPVMLVGILFAIQGINILLVGVSLPYQRKFVNAQ